MICLCGLNICCFSRQEAWFAAALVTKFLTSTAESTGVHDRDDGGVARLLQSFRDIACTADNEAWHLLDLPASYL